MGRGPLTLHVECHSGHRGDEHPVRFTLERRTVEVAEIIDRWLDPGCRYFKLRGDDGGVYILRHDTATDLWELAVYDSNTRQETRLSST